jgi:hypothetical protein
MAAHAAVEGRPGYGTSKTIGTSNPISIASLRASVVIKPVPTGLTVTDPPLPVTIQCGSKRDAVNESDPAVITQCRPEGVAVRLRPRREPPLARRHKS